VKFGRCYHIPRATSFNTTPAVAIVADLVLFNSKQVVYLTVEHYIEWINQCRFRKRIKKLPRRKDVLTALYSRFAVYLSTEIVNNDTCFRVICGLPTQLKMHSAGIIREVSYEWHLTAYHIPSHLPKFGLCKTGMQVAPAHLSVYHVHIDIHWYPEVTPKASFWIAS